MRRVGTGWFITAAVAAACGVGISLVSSLLGVTGGELIIPVFVLLFGIDAKIAGSMSILIGLPTIAVGLSRWLRNDGVLFDAKVRRGTLFPLATASVTGALLGGGVVGLFPAQALKVGPGLILIWSARRIFGHLSGPASAIHRPTLRPETCRSARSPVEEQTKEVKSRTIATDCRMFTRQS